MSKRIFIIAILLITLSACSITIFDPFHSIRVLKLGENDYRVIYFEDTPEIVKNAKYTIEEESGFLRVTLAKKEVFMRNTNKILMEDVYSITPIEQTNEFLVNESELSKTAGFTKCSRASSDESYPIFFGLNLVYFVPRESDATILDIYVFSRMINNDDDFLSIDSRSWTVSSVLMYPNPIIGNDMKGNQERVSKLKHALEINSYKCISK